MKYSIKALKEELTYVRRLVDTKAKQKHIEDKLDNLYEAVDKIVAVIDCLLETVEANEQRAEKLGTAGLF
jgi:hypothetical protein